MAEKLSKDVWVAFTKKNKLSVEDGALIKALEKFDKCDEKQHEARGAALEGIVEQVKKQVALLVKAKKEVGDKLFGQAKDKLYELLDEAEKLQKAAAQAVESQDEEADSPTLLTSAMIPLVRMLHKGEVAMHALIAVTSKKAAVLISRRAVSPARRKLLADYLQESSGVKYLVAQCTGSAGALEFQLDSSPGGLSKRLRQAVLDQTGLRTRIVVRFGEEVETEEDEEQQQADAGDAAQPDAAKIAEMNAYAARQQALEPRYLQALQSSPELAARIRALHGFAADKAEADQFAAALQGLAALEKMLDGLPGAAAPATAAAPRAPGQQPEAFVAFTQTRLAWDQTRKTIRAELQKLESEILATCKDEPDFAEIQTGAKTLYEMLEVLDERLIDKLDEALNAGTPAQRQQLHLQARAIVDDYLEFVDTDELLADIDGNGFIDTAVRATLTSRLNEMASQLGKSYSVAQAA